MFFNCSTTPSSSTLTEANTSNETLANEVSVMGYAMRTPYFRYVAYILFDKVTKRPKNFNDPIFLEELYDHRNESLRDFTHREVVNVVRRQEYGENLLKLRDRLISYLKDDVYYNRNNKFLVNGNGKELDLSFASLK